MIVSKIKIKGKKLYLLAATVIIGLVIQSCFEQPVIVEMPASVKAGENFTIKVKTSLLEVTAPKAGQPRMIIGFLAPKAWDIRKNAVITYESDYDGLGVTQTMTIVPDDQRATVGAEFVDEYANLSWPEVMLKRSGLGGNLKPDVEWVAFWSKPYTVFKGMISNPINVTINVKAGPQNTLVKLGVVVSLTLNTITDGNVNPYKNVFSECFEVTNGTRPLVDFCNPQLTATVPIQGTADDVITIDYDLNIRPVPQLIGTNVYLNARAVTVDDVRINSTSRPLFTRFTDKTGRIEFWPRQLFKLGKGTQLSHIEYFLTNAATATPGEPAVGPNPNDLTEPFFYKIGCE
ncbi:hypothetical protein DJ568_09240 [Mucilaginibacter hurinus]|uniref:DUF4961 domain-containing protein n=1 Tax=Mucilaginibacter hurinus TaxID=2201324 RepID=A0A367GPE7_9SPHI|nr:DUF4961 domain-containing protein [Mucilaginibacter hurinus]RCH55354.1 hypothetical protein DJ568_09240 [Mucilaginibacter hurinus]